MSRLSGMYAETTHDFTSMADGSHQSIDVTVPGAKLGDFALCSLDVDNKDCHIQAYVRAADTVEILASNPNGAAAAINIDSALIRVKVIPFDAI